MKVTCTSQIQPSSGIHPASYPLGTKSKMVRVWNWQITTTGARVKNVPGLITPLNTSIVWLYKGSFTFISLYKHTVMPQYIDLCTTTLTWHWVPLNWWYQQEITWWYGFHHIHNKYFDVTSQSHKWFACSEPQTVTLLEYSVSHHCTVVW
jgi:hypothetical protein